MKYKIKITAIILTLAITFIAHPFSVLNADSISSGSGTFTYGRYEYQKNIYSSITNINIDGTSINSYGTIVIDIYLYNTYTGNLYINGITGTGYINGGSYYCYGASFVTFDTDNNKIMLLINNPTDHVKVVYTINATDMYNFITNSNVSVTGSLVVSDDVETTVSDIDVKLSSCDYTLSEILALLESGGSISTYLEQINDYCQALNTDLNNFYENSSRYIKYFKYTENLNMVTDTQLYYTYSTDDLNSNSYEYYTSSNRNVNRISFEYETYPVSVSNYAVFQFQVLCYDNVDLNISAKPFIRDYHSTMGLPIDDFKLYVQRWNYNTGKTVIYLTLYIPIIYFSDYNDNIYQIDFYSLNLESVRNIKFVYYGYLDSLPDIEPYNYTESETEEIIDYTTSEIDDVASQSSEIEEQYISDLTDFKNNLDLSDYDFSLHSNSGFTYLKEKLQDIYEINEFKPFYLVPIIFMVLTVILGG